MKVLMLSTDQKIFEPGSAVAARMAEYGALVDELHIVVYTRPGFAVKKLAKNVWAYPTNCQKLLYFWTGYGICERILKKYPDMIVTSQEAMTNVLALLLRLQFPKLPFEAQVHTDIGSPYFRSESLKNYIRHLVYLFTLRRADCIRVVSKRIADFLRSKIKNKESRISVLPVFVDVANVVAAPVRVDLHKKYPQFNFIILMASRLTREKNIVMAVGAIREVIKKYPKTGLVIVGSGSEEKSLQFTVSSLQLQKNIVFEPWTNDLASYYKTADLFLLTSNYEGYGRTLVEAAAAGLPILTTNVGLAGDLFSDRELYIVPTNDKAALAKTLFEIRDNYGEAKTRAARALSAVEELPNKEKYLERIRAQWSFLL